MQVAFRMKTNATILGADRTLTTKFAKGRERQTGDFSRKGAKVAKFQKEMPEITTETLRHGVSDRRRSNQIGFDRTPFLLEPEGDRVFSQSREGRKVLRRDEQNTRQDLILITPVALLVFRLQPIQNLT